MQYNGHLARCLNDLCFKHYRYQRAQCTLHIWPGVGPLPLYPRPKAARPIRFHGSVGRYIQFAGGTWWRLNPFVKVWFLCRLNFHLYFYQSNSMKIIMQTINLSPSVFSHPCSRFHNSSQFGFSLAWSQAEERKLSLPFLHRLNEFLFPKFKRKSGYPFFLMFARVGWTPVCNF